MQIHAQHTIMILQISPNNVKHYKQEASVLISTSIVQIILITSEQSPEDFCFEIIGMGLSK